MTTCPWYVSAAAVRAWQAIRVEAPRDFDAASDALIELCAATWAERYADGERAPKTTRTGAYVYRTTRRYGALQLLVSAQRRDEGGKQQLVDVLPSSTDRVRR